MTASKARLVYLFDNAGVDVSSKFSNFTIEAADADGAFLSYSKAREGGDKDYVMKVTIEQDYSTDSIWNTMVSQVGTTWTGYYTTDVTDMDDVSATKPAFEINAIVSIPNGVVLGGETTVSQKATQTVELEWQLIDFNPATPTTSFTVGA